MPKSTLGTRIRDAMDVRNEAAGLSLGAVAQGIGKTDRYLRAIRAGQEPGFGTMEALDRLYTSLGQPGFIADVVRQQDWHNDRRHPNPAELPPLARKLLDIADDLRGAAAIEECLAERGLLPYVHIMIRESDEGLAMVHRGTKMKTASLISRDVFGRDLRSVEPRDYTQHVYDQVMPLFRSGRPILDNHSAPGLTYSCLRLPVHQFMIGMTLDPQVTVPFQLR